jgi:hypothetical protein
MRWLTFIIILSLVSTAFADDISFTAKVDRTAVNLDEQITLELLVSGDIQGLPEPASPEIPGFQVYGAGRSQQFSYVNGAVSSSVSYKYILMPQQTGTLTIPSQQITHKGRTYATSPISISVTQGAPPPTQSGRRQEAQSDDQQPVRSGNRDFFIEALVGQDTVFVNEQLTLTFRFYQGKRIYSQPEYSPPSATGFWVEDLPPQKNYYRTVGGRDYYVAEVKTALFATGPGKKTIGKATLQIKGDDLFSMFDRDPFGLFDRKRSPAKPVLLETEPIEVVVLPLPAEGKLPDFSGSVGDFKMSTSIDKTEVEVNQPVTVTVKLSGIGNIKTLAEPVLPDLSDFRIFSSGKSENVSKAGYVVGGSKVFETTFVPKKPGSFTIPAIATNFFDPSDRAYRELAGQEFEIHVTGVSNEEIASRGTTFPGRSDLVATDIRPIVYSENAAEDVGGLLVFSLVFVAINAIPVLSVAAVVALRRRQDRLQGDVAYRRLRRAVRFAKSKLANAQTHLGRHDADAFYAEIARALLQYIGDKHNISAPGMTNPQIEALFAERSVPEELRKRFFELTALCDEGRFSKASHGSDTMMKTLGEAEKWIVDFEEKQR